MQAAQPPERIAEERAQPGVLIVGRDKRVGPGFYHKQAMIEALFRVFQLDEVSGQNYPIEQISANGPGPSCRVRKRNSASTPVQAGARSFSER